MNIEVIGAIVWLLTLVVVALTFFPRVAFVVAVMIACIGAFMVTGVALAIVVIHLNDWYSRRFP